VSRPRLDRVARALAGIALGFLVLAAVLPALIPALRLAPAQVVGACRAALVAAFPPLDPVRSHLALIPVGLALLGLAVALFDRAWQQHRLHNFLRGQRSRSIEPRDALYSAVCQARVQRRIRVLAAPAAAPAFTAGFLWPCIYLSEELFRVLTPAELNAAFQHELEHLRRRDPLRIASLRFLERVLFWVPLARALTDAAAEAIEFRADDAARPVGPLNVAGAIVKAARLVHTPAPALAPSLGRISVSRRARRLMGEPLPRPRIPTLQLAATVLVLSLVWASALFASSVHGHEAGGAPCNVCVVRSHMAEWFGERP
jgi:beta-lactamase regulating signal transducer with metallopeptidase domain